MRRIMAHKESANIESEREVKCKNNKRKQKRQKKLLNLLSSIEHRNYTTIHCVVKRNAVQLACVNNC